MAKSNGRVRPQLKRLPKSNNGTTRTHSGFGLYAYQKDELRRRAHARGGTSS